MYDYDSFIMHVMFFFIFSPAPMLCSTTRPRPTSFTLTPRLSIRNTASRAPIPCTSGIRVLSPSGSRCNDTVLPDSLARPHIGLPSAYEPSQSARVLNPRCDRT